VKAVILAGGKGTRMGNLVKEKPKPMIEIGGNPILTHQINLLKKYNITDIFILVNHLKQSIIDHYGDGKDFGVKIKYFEESTPLGTVGGLKEIEEYLSEDFMVVYGDVMVNMHLERLISFHQKKSSECTLVLHPNDHPYDSDLVETDDSGRVTSFYPKPHDTDAFLPNLVNAGLYVFSPAIFKFIEKGRKADFGRDIFPAIYSDINMFGYNTIEYLKDMGTPSRLEEVEKDFTSGKISRANLEYSQKAVFLDRDGVINEEISFISKPEDMVLYDFTPAAIRKINQSEFKSIIITNQSVIARNLCTVKELKVIHNKMETLLGKEKAKIDAVYYCPHHPDKGYPEERPEYKIDCFCRKPKPGMILDAAFDYNIDLNKSFMIGDNDRDIEAGYNAGCTTVGVMTGYGLRKASARPHFFFTNLLEAVNFIIDEPYKYIYEKIANSNLKTPALILIGGNAQSGKSTLAAYLEWKFKNKKRKILRIELDNWILPEEHRNEKMNVYNRFQMLKIESDIQLILSGIPVKMNTYPNHPERNPQPITYKYTGQDFIIIEGVVGLSSEVLRELANYKLFVSIGRKEHKKRIYQYYRWRDKSDEDIEKLYRSRMKDEYSLIEKESNFADFIVTSTAT
jgi:histidinol-phosphate phosphatase family protein